jgi:NAD dependent epimerase/dehydratase family enzyme
MRIAITGSSGLVGSALVSTLVNVGHQVVCLRRPVDWDPDKGVMDPAILAGASAVVHLAGENIAAGRWTARRKERIRNSRVAGTRLVAQTIAGMNPPPEVLVSALRDRILREPGSRAVARRKPAGLRILAIRLPRMGGRDGYRDAKRYTGRASAHWACLK